MTVLFSFFHFLIAIPYFYFLASPLEKRDSIHDTMKYRSQVNSYLDQQPYSWEVPDVQISSVNQSSKIQVQVQVQKATALYGAGERKQSLKVINEIEGSVLALKEYNHLSNLLRMKSLILYQSGFKDEGLQLMERSLHYGEKIADRDSHHLMMGYALLAKTSMEEDQIEKHKLRADAYVHMSSISAHHPRRLNALASAMSSYAMSLMDKKEVDSAETYLLNALRLFSADTLYKVPDTFYVLETLGILYVDNNRLQEALDYFQMALKHLESAQNANHKSRIYIRMHDVYDKMEKQTEADYYLRQYTIIKDSLDIAKDDLVNTFSAKKSTSSPTNSDELHTTNNWGIFAGFILFSFLALFLWYLRRSILFQKQDKVKQVAITVSTAAIPSPLYSSYTSPSQVELDELYDLIKTNNPTFLTKFCALYPHYIDRLNKLAFPELVSSELEICAYLKLNLDTKEISRYTHRSIRSIENRRYRVRKKLNLSSDIDLKNYLLNLS